MDKAERLDDFYFQALKADKYAGLAEFLKLVFVISHGQASVERGFNINAQHARTNIKEESLFARRIVVDYLQKEEVEPEDKVTK